MHTLYLCSVWLHIMAATTWIGGIIFLVLVIVPWLRAEGRVVGPTFLRATGERFRRIAWVCFAILVVTGVINLWLRGVRPDDFSRAAWLNSAFGTTVVVKLGLFVVVLGISALHDFVVGPRASAALERDPNSTQAAKLRRQASLLGRTNGIMALLLVAVAVWLVRG